VGAQGAQGSCAMRALVAPLLVACLFATWLLLVAAWLLLHAWHGTPGCLHLLCPCLSSVMAGTAVGAEGAHGWSLSMHGSLLVAPIEPH
jgi:hypothetical protein